VQPLEDHWRCERGDGNLAMSPGSGISVGFSRGAGGEGAAAVLALKGEGFAASFLFSLGRNPPGRGRETSRFEI